MLSCLLILVLVIIFVIYFTDISYLGLKDNLLTRSDTKSPDTTRNDKPYLVYTVSGGIVGYALEINIYINGRYESYDKGYRKGQGMLNKKQMEYIDNVVNTINKITEKDVPIEGADILYETLKTQNKTTSVNLYKKYKNPDEDIVLLQYLLNLNNKIFDLDQQAQ